MPDEITNTPGDGGQPGNPGTQPPAQPASGDAGATSARSFSEAEVQEAMKRAADGAWAQARRHYESRQPAQPAQRQAQPAQQTSSQQLPAASATPSQGTDDTDPMAELAKLRAERDFEDALPDEAGLSKQQRIAMRGIYVAVNPADRGEWIGNFLDTFGLRTTAQPGGGDSGSNGAASAGTPAAAQTPQVPSGPPASDGGSPSVPRDLSPSVRASDLTREDVLALQAKHGRVKANRMIAERINAQIRGR